MNYRGRGDAPLRFETSPRVALGLPRARDARIAARSGRLLHVLSVQDMGGRARLVAQRSSDGGDSFSPPVSVSAASAYVVGSGESAPVLLLSGAGLCAAWSQARSGGGSELMLSSSQDGGESWTRPLRLSDRPDVYHGYPALAAAPDGTLWAAWLDARVKPGNGTLDLFVARSSNGGKSFEKATLAARGACPSCRLCLAVTANGTLHLAWRGLEPGGVRDIRTCRREIGAPGFTPPQPIARDAWRASECPHSGPALVAVGEALHLAWLSEGAGMPPGIRWSVSDDNGRSFTTPVLASRGVLDAAQPSLSATEAGQVRLVFSGRPGGGDGWSAPRAFVADVTTWVSASRGPAAIPGAYEKVRYPVAQGDATGRLWVLWSADDSVLLSRARTE